MPTNVFNIDTEISGKLTLGGTSDVVISTTGNVGIGVALPSTKLEVSGVITATGGTSTNWNTAYGWGDHAAVGYLTSFTETDPVFSASAAAGITSTNISNWNTAYGWGDHASAGYLTSYTETDTLATVTNRGSSTTNSITLGGTSTNGSVLAYGTYSNGNIVVLGGMRSSGGPMIGYGLKPDTATSHGFVSSSGATLTRGAYYINGNEHRWYSGGSQTAAVGGAVSVSQSMTLNSSGYLGIGTTSPDRKLHVYQGDSGITGYALTGGIDIESTSISGINILSPNTGNGRIYFGAPSSSTSGAVEYVHSATLSSAHMKFRAGNAERMRIDGSGNVGIGTTSPSSKLEVISGASHGTGFTQTRSGHPSFSLLNGGTNSVYLGVAPDGGSYSTFMQVVEDGTDINYIRFNTGASTERMRILPAGQVAIGRTTAFTVGGTATLSVNGDLISWGNSSTDLSYFRRLSTGNFQWQTYNGANAGNIHLQPYGGNVGIATTSPKSTAHIDGVLTLEGGARSNPSAGINEAVVIDYQLSGTSLGRLRSRDWDNGVWKDFIIQANDITLDADGSLDVQSPAYFTNGNVGIGTTSPLAALHINKSGVPQLLLDGGGDTTGDIVVPSGEILQIGHWNTSTLTYTDRLRISTNGNVGIGTTSPAGALHVQSSSTKLFLSNTDYNNATSTGSGMILQTGASSGNTYGQIYAFQSGNTAYANLVVPGGNVGIGTTSPSTNLQTGDGSAGVDTSIRAYHSDGAYTEIRGYGIETNRTTAYIRPTGDKNAVMAFGNDGRTWNYVNVNTNYFVVATDTTEHMRIAANGNVGIGTTSPSTKLDVDGYAKFAKHYREGGFSALGATVDDWYTIADFSLNSATYTYENFKGTVNWGYGGSTSWYAVEFDVYFRGNSSLAADGAFVRWSYRQTGNAEGKGGSAIRIIRSDDVTYEIQISPITNYGVVNWEILSPKYSSAVTLTTYDTVQTASTALSSSKIVQDSNFYVNGNVGIGTTSPTEKLEVAGNTILDASNARLKVKAGITGTNGGIDWTFNTDSTQYAKIELDYDNRVTTGLLIDSGYPLTLDYSSSRFAVQYNGVEQMRINTSGNVGIGTTSPSRQLHVSGSTFGAMLISGVANDAFTEYSDGTNVWKAGIDYSQSAYRITHTNFNGAGISIDSSGNLTADGDVTAYSDARLKENVETLPNALESVKAMRGVTYNKIGEEKQSIGVIAQEVQAVLPQLVSEHKDEMLSVAYGNITAVLIEAIKEQQEQIDELKAIINGLTK